MFTHTYSFEEITPTASKILPHLHHKVVLLQAGMGVGKTTLTKALTRELGVEEVVSSPTFSIINEYMAGQEKVYHFDFYRIEHLSQAIEIGVEEYFYSGNWCFIEWAEHVEALLPCEYSIIHIQELSPTLRLLKIENITSKNNV